MILVFEFTWTGSHHAPGNAATLRAFSAAFPDETIRVYAEASHLAELEHRLRESGNFEFRKMRLSSRFLHRPGLVSFRRMAQEALSLKYAVARAPAEPCLIILISATSTSIFAASIVQRFMRQSNAVLVGLHGNLNDIRGWRPRNPFAKALDLRSALERRPSKRLRYFVLERALKDSLQELLPSAASVTDVLNLPINLGEEPEGANPPLLYPLRFGFVGQATEAKGISRYLELAQKLKQRYPQDARFFVIGRAYPGDDLSRFAVLDHPITHEHLERVKFIELLASMHFVVLPYQEGYYELSASGALLDAMTWQKPIVTLPTPNVEDLFRTYGDIGYLCRSYDQLVETIAELVQHPDPVRYESQRANLARARSARSFYSLKTEYEDTVLRLIPELATGNGFGRHLR